MRWHHLALLALVCSATAAVAANRAQDQAERRVAAALATNSLKAAFRAKLNQWRRGYWIQKRREYVAALGARLSESNPVLFDLEAVILKGRWSAGSLLSLDGRMRSFVVEDSVPERGAQVTGHPGELCIPGCHDAGYEPHRLGDDAYEVMAANALGLKAGQPGWTALIDGKAAWALYPAGKGLVILVTACERQFHECGPAAVVLTPQGEAKMEVLN
jgi:hypothetical protein